MITHPRTRWNPGHCARHALDLDVLPQSESVFALSNGHIGWRGNLDEGEPYGLPGSYLNGVHELHALPYAEAGYGYPESGQTAINVTNGKIVRLLVDDEPFDLRYGKLHSHERVLDLRSGLLRRTCEWTSPAGGTVRVRSTRLVSFTQRAIAAVAYEVEPVDAKVRVVVQSELVANEQLPRPTGDPRVAAGLESPLNAEEDFAPDMRLRLVHRTTHSGLRVAAAADHVVHGPAPTRTSSESSGDVGRLTVTSVLVPGEQLRLEKLSPTAGPEPAHCRPCATRSTRHSPGAEHRLGRARAISSGSTSTASGPRADVEVDGDGEIQQAVRFALFHVLQAGRPRGEACHPGQGTDRLRLRRSLLLGHRDVRTAAADLHLA